MKYPFSPEVLDALPEELAELFRNLEVTLLEEICSRLKIKDNLNEVTVQDIKALRSHGISLKEIEKAIKETSGISQDKLNKLMNDVVERNQKYYTELIDFAKVTQPEVLVGATEIDAIRRQTEEEFSNITRSLGFLVDSGRTKLEPAKAYQWALDNALLQIDSGAINYNEAIKNSVRQLADSGIRVVEYESGHMDHADVAARRAVMTGVSQLCAKYTEQSAEYLETDYFEISAHIGARDVEGPSPWSSHKAWQGKVYSVRSGDKYPNIYAVCGLGYVDGLEGANCRHIRFPFVDGVSMRTYTDEELEHIDDGHDCEYEGRHYTAYEATQKQREIERTIRKLKRREASYKAAGIKDEELVTSVRRKRLSQKYKEFSKVAGLPEQTERTKIIKLFAKQSGGKHYSPIDANDQRDVSAAKAYRKISRNSKDVFEISKNTGFKESEIVQIKRHIFFEKHKKHDNYGLLDPDYDMAVAWGRLSKNEFLSRDITLLRHELLESKFEKRYNLPIAKAHYLAKQTYDWEKELEEETGGGEADDLLQLYWP